MSLIKANPRAPKPPKIILLFTYLTFFLPTILFLLAVQEGGYLTPEKTVAFHQSRASMFTFLLMTILPGIFYENCIRMIRSYDGTEESLARANKFHKIFLWVCSMLPAFILFLGSIGACVEAGISFKTDYGIAIAATSVSSYFSVGTLCYVSLNKFLSRYMKFIKLREEFIAMKMSRFTQIVSSQTLMGVFLGIMAPAMRFMGKDLKDPIQFFMFNLIPTGIILVGLGTLSNYINMREKQRLIDMVSDFIKRISDGDYTDCHINVETRDNLGLAIHGLNKFGNINIALLSGIKYAGDKSAKMADELNKGVGIITDELEIVSNQIQNVKEDMNTQSNSVDQTQSTIKNIVNNISVLNDHIQNQASSVSQSSAAIEEMVANINSVTNILRQNTVTVESLNMESSSGQKKVETTVEIAHQISEESKGMQEASEMIQNMAEQTNLLAMNAAIEAAHAGDAGKGFAVVADEIRKLAEDSNEQSKSISDRLGALGISIENVTQNILEVQEQFSRIFELTKKVQYQEEAIMAAMQEQNSGSSQILEAIRMITDSTQTVQNNSNEMLNGSDSVLSEMEKLTDITKAIDEAILAISEANNAVDNSVSTLKFSVEENIKTAKQLAEQTEAFTLP